MTFNYLDRFMRASETRKGKLVGDRILIELLDEDLKKTAGGILLAESEHARADYVMLKTKVGVVLEVGQGYYNSKSGETDALTVRPGYVVWISENGIRFCTTLPGVKEGLPKKILALGTEGEIHKYWESIADYEADQAAFDKTGP